MSSWNAEQIFKAKAEGKLVVTDGHGYIFYGRKANDWAKQWRAAHPDTRQGIPVVVVPLSEEQWPAFAQQFQLDDEGGGD